MVVPRNELQWDLPSDLPFAKITSLDPEQGEVSVHSVHVGRTGWIDFTADISTDFTADYCTIIRCGYNVQVTIGSVTWQSGGDVLINTPVGVRPHDRIIFTCGEINPNNDKTTVDIGVVEPNGDIRVPEVTGAYISISYITLDPWPVIDTDDVTL